MKMKRKILAALLCLSLAVTVVMPVCAAEPTEDEPLTRSALVAELHEASGNPVVNYAMNYPDVSDDDAYAEAIRWATSEQLVNGYDDGTFRPDETVSREQMAAMLYRYAQNNGLGFTGAWAFRLPYSDAAQIHSYAYEAVCWMTMNQVMDAAEGDAFRPGAPVTTTEADQILQRFTAVIAQD